MRQPHNLDSDIETACCPLCGSADASIIHTWQPFAVVRCNACTLAYLSPRPREATALQGYREDDYFSGTGGAGYENYRTQERGLRDTFRRFLEELKQRGLAGGSLLEIGSGYGFFLAEAGAYFSAVSGTELSAQAAAYGRRLSSARLHVGDAGSLPPDWTDFDAAVMVNVIEHVYRPVEMLRAVRERLRHGGWMVVATPDFGSLWHTVLQKRWPSFKIPEHVAFYTAATLERLLRDAGFDEIRRVPFLHAFPLRLVAGKCGLRLGGRLGDLNVWIPGTMAACAGRAPSAAPLFRVVK